MSNIKFGKGIEARKEGNTIYIKQTGKRMGCAFNVNDTKGCTITGIDPISDEDNLDRYILGRKVPKNPKNYLFKFNPTEGYTDASLQYPDIPSHINTTNMVDLLKYYNQELTEKVGIPEGRDVLNTFPTVKEQLKKLTEEKLKQNKMRTKKFYHTFDFQEREITLLLAVQENLPSFFSGKTATLSLTYSVRLHEDEEIEGLTKKIALGRLEKGKLLDNFTVDMRFAFKLAYLKGVAFCFENEIKRGDLEIVGVTSGVAKENKVKETFQETNENVEQ
jgi:hypothetical protein